MLGIPTVAVCGGLCHGLTAGLWDGPRSESPRATEVRKHRRCLMGTSRQPLRLPLLLVACLCVTSASFCSVPNKTPQLQGVRINKVFTAKFSRRETDRLVADGRIGINGQPATPGDRVMAGDSVTLDGKPFDSASAFAEAAALLGGAAPSMEAGAAFVYLKYWKPRGVTCTTDLKVRDNLIDALGFEGPERLFPVGRLDKDSEGLILLTNDGRVPNAINRAARAHEKVYEVECDRPVSEAHLRQLAKGVVITTTAQRDRGPPKILTAPTRPCRVSRLASNAFVITLTEGRNRQIRRMCEEVGGYEVTTLHRRSVMGIELNGLPGPGSYCALEGSDLDCVLGAVKEAEQYPYEPSQQQQSDVDHVDDGEYGFVAYDRTQQRKQPTPSQARRDGRRARGSEGEWRRGDGRGGRGLGRRGERDGGRGEWRGAGSPGRGRGRSRGGRGGEGGREGTGSARRGGLGSRYYEERRQRELHRPTERKDEDW